LTNLIGLAISAPSSVAMEGSVAKAVHRRDLPANHRSAEELATRFHESVLSALHLIDRDVPVDERISLDELVKLFEAAAKTGRQPTKEILAAFPALASTWWAKRMIAVEQAVEHRALDADRAVSCLAEVESFLHPLMLTDRMVGQMPGYSDDERQVLVNFSKMISQVEAILTKTPRGSTVAAWHRPAEIVALNAILAWRIAGRKVIGVDNRSPLASFVVAWLDRAHVKSATTAAIASVFENGPVRQWAQSTADLLATK
jgi:hypothetical protein